MYVIHTIILKSPEHRTYRANEKYLYLSYMIPRSQYYSYYERVE